MKIKTVCHILCAMMTVVALFSSCTEDIDTSDRYTFTGKTIVSYLQDYPETYSEYSTLLDSVMVSDFSQSTMSQLLSARGNYTCFAPTNEAIQKYLDYMKDSLKVISEATWEAPEFQAIDPETQTRKLLEETRKTIVYNSLIDGGDDIEAYMTSDISERVEENQMLGLPNMRDRKLMCTKGNGTRYAINGSNISDTNCDIYAINGRIHQVDKVIAPNTQKANEFFEKIIDDKKYGLYTFAALVEACGLNEELKQDEDEEYYRKRMVGDLEDLPSHPTYKPGILPERRYHGYTIFAEEDSWWEKTLGLEDSTITKLSPEELVEMVADYVTGNNLALSTAHAGTDYTNEDNALNQFVTYHIVPGKLETSKLVIHFNELWYNLTDRIKKASVFDFYTTMGKRRLIKTYEASRTCDDKRNTIYLNRFPVLKNGRGNDQDYTEVRCDENKKGIEIYTADNPEIYNAYLYRISDCLYYNDEQANIMASERIRIDFSSMFPELMSNDIRDNENYTSEHQCVGMPVSSKYQYLENCDISDQSKFYYLSGRLSATSCWQDYEGDEISVVGNYEITFKLPPVPKDGLYELRLCVQTNDRRGMCQVYWGNDKSNMPTAGLPIDMRMGGKTWYVKGGAPMESILGYEEDVEGDDELNAENDKKMRNNMCMKAPNNYYVYGSQLTMRSQDAGKILRRIIVREEMKAEEVYYLRLKSVLRDPDTELFIDFMEFCPKEVYDNPLVPEDIW